LLTGHPNGAAHYGACRLSFPRPRRVINVLEFCRHRIVDRIWDLAKEARARGDDQGFSRRRKIMTAVARDALGLPPLKGFDGPYRGYENMPEDVRQLMRTMAEGKLKTALLAAGQPLKVHQGDEDYAHTMRKWEAQRESDAAWLKRHMNDGFVVPIFRDIIFTEKFEDFLTEKAPSQRKGESDANYAIRKAARLRARRYAARLVVSNRERLKPARR
jgi:hypothetical protein